MPATRLITSVEEEAFDLGMDAMLEGKDMDEDNPYEPGTPEHRYFEKGFRRMAALEYGWY